MLIIIRGGSELSLVDRQDRTERKRVANRFLAAALALLMIFDPTVCAWAAESGTSLFTDDAFETSEGQTAEQLARAQAQAEDLAASRNAVLGLDQPDGTEDQPAGSDVQMDPFADFALTHAAALDWKAVFSGTEFGAGVDSVDPEVRDIVRNADGSCRAVLALTFKDASGRTVLNALASYRIGFRDSASEVDALTVDYTSPDGTVDGSIITDWYPGSSVRSARIAERVTDDSGASLLNFRKNFSADGRQVSFTQKTTADEALDDGSTVTRVVIASQGEDGTLIRSTTETTKDASGRVTRTASSKTRHDGSGALTESSEESFDRVYWGTTTVVRTGTKTVSSLKRAGLTVVTAETTGYDAAGRAESVVKSDQNIRALPDGGRTAHIVETSIGYSEGGTARGEAARTEKVRTYDASDELTAERTITVNHSGPVLVARTTEDVFFESGVSTGRKVQIEDFVSGPSPVVTRTFYEGGLPVRYEEEVTSGEMTVLLVHELTYDVSGGTPRIVSVDYSARREYSGSMASRGTVTTTGRREFTYDAEGVLTRTLDVSGTQEGRSASFRSASLTEHAASPDGPSTTYWVTERASDLSASVLTDPESVIAAADVMRTGTAGRSVYYTRNESEEWTARQVHDAEGLTNEGAPFSIVIGDPDDGSNDPDDIRVWGFEGAPQGYSMGLTVARETAGGHVTEVTRVKGFGLSIIDDATGGVAAVVDFPNVQEVALGGKTYTLTLEGDGVVRMAEKIVHPVMPAYFSVMTTHQGQAVPITVDNQGNVGIFFGGRSYGGVLDRDALTVTFTGPLTGTDPSSTLTLHFRNLAAPGASIWLEPDRIVLTNRESGALAVRESIYQSGRLTQFRMTHETDAEIRRTVSDYTYQQVGLAGYKVNAEVTRIEVESKSAPGILTGSSVRRSFYEYYIEGQVSTERNFKTWTVDGRTRSQGEEIRYWSDRQVAGTTYSNVLDGDAFSQIRFATDARSAVRAFMNFANYDAGYYEDGPDGEPIFRPARASEGIRNGTFTYAVLGESIGGVTRVTIGAADRVGDPSPNDLLLYGVPQGLPEGWAVKFGSAYTHITAPAGSAWMGSLAVTHDAPRLYIEKAGRKIFFDGAGSVIELDGTEYEVFRDGDWRLIFVDRNAPPDLEITASTSSGPGSYPDVTVRLRPDGTASVTYQGVSAEGRFDPVSASVRIRDPYTNDGSDEDGWLIELKKNPQGEPRFLLKTITVNNAPAAADGSRRTVITDYDKGRVVRGYTTVRSSDGALLSEETVRTEYSNASDPQRATAVITSAISRDAAGRVTGSRETSAYYQYAADGTVNIELLLGTFAAGASVRRSVRYTETFDGIRSTFEVADPSDSYIRSIGGLAYSGNIKQMSSIMTQSYAPDGVDLWTVEYTKEPGSYDMTARLMKRWNTAGTEREEYLVVGEPDLYNEITDDLRINGGMAEGSPSNITYRFGALRDESVDGPVKPFVGYGLFIRIAGSSDPSSVAVTRLDYPSEDILETGDQGYDVRFDAEGRMELTASPAWYRQRVDAARAVLLESRAADPPIAQSRIAALETAAAAFTAAAQTRLAGELTAADASVRLMEPLRADLLNLSAVEGISDAARDRLLVHAAEIGAWIDGIKGTDRTAFENDLRSARDAVLAEIYGTVTSLRGWLTAYDTWVDQAGAASTLDALRSLRLDAVPSGALPDIGTDQLPLFGSDPGDLRLNALDARRDALIELRSDPDRVIPTSALWTPPASAAHGGTDVNILDWNSLDHIDRYAVYRRIYGRTEWEKVADVDGRIRFIDADIDPARAYQYEVRAVSADGVEMSAVRAAVSANYDRAYDGMRPDNVLVLVNTADVGWVDIGAAVEDYEKASGLLDPLDESDVRGWLGLDADDVLWGPADANGDRLNSAWSVKQDAQKRIWAPLGVYYAMRRGIPKENLVFLRNIPVQERARMGVEEFDIKVLQPILAHMRAEDITDRITTIVSVFRFPVVATSNVNSGWVGYSSSWEFALSDGLRRAMPVGGSQIAGQRPGRPVSRQLGDAYFATTRIDAQDITTSRRMIDDAIWSEENYLFEDSDWVREESGLRAFFDYRGAYASYDPQFRIAAAIAYESGYFSKPGDAACDPMTANECSLSNFGVSPDIWNTFVSDHPDYDLDLDGRLDQTFLRVGWYEWLQYQDYYDFARGAVAWNLDSSNNLSYRLSADFIQYGPLGASDLASGQSFDVLWQEVLARLAGQVTAAGSDSLENLNRVITDPRLLDKWKALQTGPRIQQVTTHQYLRNLLQETEPYRGLDYDAMSPEQKKGITTLNRLLLFYYEQGYTWIPPAQLPATWGKVADQWWGSGFINDFYTSDGRLMKRGATVTLGAVDEPGLGGHTNPRLFTGYLMQGFSFGEVASVADAGGTYTQMSYNGDPLYRPFAFRQGPKVTEGTVEGGTRVTLAQSSASVVKHADAYREYAADGRLTVERMENGTQIEYLADGRTVVTQGNLTANSYANSKTIDIYDEAGRWMRRFQVPMDGTSGSAAAGGYTGTEDRVLLGGGHDADGFRDIFIRRTIPGSDGTGREEIFNDLGELVIFGPETPFAWNAQTTAAFDTVYEDVQQPGLTYKRVLSMAQKDGSGARMTFTYVGQTADIQTADYTDGAGNVLASFEFTRVRIDEKVDGRTVSRLLQEDTRIDWAGAAIPVDRVRLGYSYISGDSNMKTRILAGLILALKDAFDSEGRQKNGWRVQGSSDYDHSYNGTGFRYYWTPDGAPLEWPEQEGSTGTAVFSDGSTTGGFTDGFRFAEGDGVTGSSDPAKKKIRFLPRRLIAA
jgi:hypothetical protein